ncbi:MAG: transcription-repair coupling factor [Gammaproteobacteria bacterium]|nr:transcription-repair coupling factor [Gammaproteobacteria bacterium]MBU3987701.1 transcription-repair coupling factor [Gammaproteobacteria bacterium]MBU4003669.1 transcription-repair coupling factor [Gammaproteobacteria bacterium]MBU4021783.1 transcription-repair coupling factor [Gammaproteobacteria bacterium]MBU4096482.1 transcription-repair coupling factor [Gammaproteobacteria bacterium]
MTSFLQLPAPPKAGQRIPLPELATSADALAIVQLARTTCAGRLLTVITASPLEAQRLTEEIAWFAPDLRVHLLPDWETLPYDHFSPHQDLISERLATLFAVTQGHCDVLLVAAATAVTRLAPPAFLAAHTFFMKKGDRLELDKLRAQMTLAGYQHVTQVVAPGEYSVRGGLIDLFPMGTVLPYRIELFDDEIETLRSFDVDSQRTLYPVPEIRLLPAREMPAGEAGRTTFRQRFRDTFEGDASRIGLYKDVSNGIMPAGIEYYLPLFFEKTATLFDYLPTETTLLLHGDVPAALTEFWTDTQGRYKMLDGDRARPILPPSELFLRDEDFFVAANAFAQYVQKVGARETASAESLNLTETAAALPNLAVNRKADDPLAALRHFLDGFAGRVLLLAESPGRRETLNEYLGEHELPATPCTDFAAFRDGRERLMLATGPLSAGFILPAAQLAAQFAIITENELYAATARPRHKRSDARRANLEGWLRDLSELKIGDPVVHESHGIGRYLGLVHLDYGAGQDGEMSEFLHLEYANETKLYVPVAQLEVISRYSGVDPEAVQLHTLGSGQWDKAKKKAAEQVRDTAAELLNLYALRAMREGHQFSFKQQDLEAFAEGFGFEETPDQQAAIEAVIADMQSGKPMDRLVCGDVGFGKTEVAMRAAFVAIADGKQVAVLCPTTLLAEQHYQNFADRFASFAVKVAEISRFKSKEEQAAAIELLGQGKIDILIGTHRLLQKDVHFERLGLVIIDEEHRFGVRQKEALKALRASVDVLTLTATPIPRTLGLSLEGLRDFSVIATPPQKRLAIKTFVSRWSTGQVREAALREFKRGGQVYFLHNEVDTIENMRERLAKLLPEARIVIGHGQLPERELERVMREFTQQKHNLLLCSTIIETGIDNPHANTIIINRADKFGLAQLHQLRGRVGRSHHQAYAYLLTDENAKPTTQAQRRLDAIQAMEELGSGFFLAMHDLEIRGAGEVLGESQSGEIHEIGFALYTNMLNAAVRALKDGKEIPDLTQPLAITAEINLRTPALLPDAYCPDVHERLTLYKRLANCDAEDDLRAMQEELIDRFGELPPQTQALIETHRLRLLGHPLGIAKLDAGPNIIQLQFIPQPPIDPANIIKLIQSNRAFKLAGPDKLSWQKPTATLKERVLAVKELFNKLS